MNGCSFTGVIMDRNVLKYSKDSREEKKELIYNSAIKVLSQKGFHEATVHDIAKEAGLASGTIYLYFKNKEDILISLFNKKWNDFFIDLNSATEKYANLIQKMEARLNYIVNYFKENSDLVNIMFIESYHFLFLEPEILEMFYKEWDYISSTFGQILEEGRKEKIFSYEGSSVSVAKVIFGVVESFLKQNLIHNGKFPEDDINTIIKFVLNGLKAKEW